MYIGIIVYVYIYVGSQLCRQHLKTENFSSHFQSYCKEQAERIIEIKQNSLT